MTRSAFDLALDAEVIAARTEGHLMAQPELSGLWHAEVAISEAVASVGMEDVRISEGDILSRIAENRTDTAEARALEDALRLYKILRRPGQFPDDLGALARRIGTFFPEGQVSVDLMTKVFEGCVGRAPVMEALRATAIFGAGTGFRAPMAERAVFMIADHIARRAAAHDVRYRDDLRGLSGPVQAYWVAAPSIALTRSRFALWRPQTEFGVEAILEHLATSMHSDLGKLISLRTWLDIKETMRAEERKSSRAGEAADLFGINPVMTSDYLATSIGVTPRGALGILDRLVEYGLVVEVTRRRSARIWATPGLAALLAQRAERMPREGGGRAQDVSREGEEAGFAQRSDMRDANLDDAFAEMDAALATFDAIMERIQKR